MRQLTESAAWREIARRFAAPAHLARLNGSDMGLCRAATILAGDDDISSELEEKMHDRIYDWEMLSHPYAYPALDNENMYDPLNRPDRCMAALWLAEEAAHDEQMAVMVEATTS